MFQWEKLENDAIFIERARRRRRRYDFLFLRKVLMIGVKVFEHVREARDSQQALKGKRSHADRNETDGEIQMFLYTGLVNDV